jgi:hypothetical protein
MANYVVTKGFQPAFEHEPPIRVQRLMNICNTVCHKASLPPRWSSEADGSWPHLSRLRTRSEQIPYTDLSDWTGGVVCLDVSAQLLTWICKTQRALKTYLAPRVYSTAKRRSESKRDES